MCPKYGGHLRWPALTDAIVARMKADKDSYVWDSGLPGLCVRLRSGGTKTWYVRYKREGRDRWVKLALVEHMDVAKARREAAIILDRVVQGEDPASDKQRAAEAKAAAERERVEAEKRAAEAAALTVSAMLDAWLARKRAEGKLSPKTLEQYDRLAENRIKTAIGDRVAAEVRRRDVEKMHTDMASIPFEANRTLATLSSCYSWGVKNEWSKANPCLGIPRYAERARTSFLDAEQIGRVVVALDKEAATYPEDADCLLFLALTGARLTEGRTLRWDALDLDAKTATLHEHKTARRTGAKNIELPDGAVGLLKRRMSAKKTDDVYVFGGASPRPERGVEHAWERVRKAAGVSVRIHDLRHTYASLLAAAGHDLLTISRLLGHSGIQVTQRYAHLTKSKTAGAANDAAKLFAVRPNERKPSEPRVRRAAWGKMREAVRG